MFATIIKVLRLILAELETIAENTTPAGGADGGGADGGGNDAVG